MTVKLRNIAVSEVAPAIDPKNEMVRFWAVFSAADPTPAAKLNAPPQLVTSHDCAPEYTPTAILPTNAVSLDDAARDTTVVPPQ